MRRTREPRTKQYWRSPMSFHRHEMVRRRRTRHTTACCRSHRRNRPIRRQLHRIRKWLITWRRSIHTPIAWVGKTATANVRTIILTKRRDETLRNTRKSGPGLISRMTFALSVTRSDTGNPTVRTSNGLRTTRSTRPCTETTTHGCTHCRRNG